MALIIQGYLRANEHSPNVPLDESVALEQCIRVIREECDDWAENFEDKDAVAPENINVDLNVPRTPYNLRSAMQALAEELTALDGTKVTINFDQRP